MRKVVQLGDVTDLKEPRFGPFLAIHEDVIGMLVKWITQQQADHAKQR